MALKILDQLPTSSKGNHHNFEDLKVIWKSVQCQLEQTDGMEQFYNENKDRCNGQKTLPKFASCKSSVSFFQYIQYLNPIFKSNIQIPYKPCKSWSSCVSSVSSVPVSSGSSHASDMLLVVVFVTMTFRGTPGNLGAPNHPIHRSY